MKISTSNFVSNYAITNNNKKTSINESAGSIAKTSQVGMPKQTNYITFGIHPDLKYILDGFQREDKVPSLERAAKTATKKVLTKADEEAMDKIAKLLKNKKFDSCWENNRFSMIEFLGNANAETFDGLKALIDIAKKANKPAYIPQFSDCTKSLNGVNSPLIQDLSKKDIEPDKFFSYVEKILTEVNTPEKAAFWNHVTEGLGVGDSFVLEQPNAIKNAIHNLNDKNSVIMTKLADADVQYLYSAQYLRTDEQVLAAERFLEERVNPEKFENFCADLDAEIRNRDI